MYQKDYVLRMIEMIGELIAQILGLLNKKNTKKASQILENAYRDFLKEDASFFRSLSKEKLTNSLLQEHNYTDEHLQVLAELFYAEAEIQNTKEQKALASEYYEKSLILFRFVVENSTNFSIRLEQRINLLEKKIN
ncbi:hypothetical protein [Marinifilum flexuosum]|uniref:Uncharacterized protein n=1 Tax=Marinifilum flexuosum TaxID=1117708 RepID=A0A419X2S0_9BACT|nr:hypothetical protein [Marinifilum flexuosum]RKE01998.1 hypothetical protein BXY64_2073 [Marinifilum flexuosum]